VNRSCIYTRQSDVLSGLEREKNKRDGVLSHMFAREYAGV